MSRRAMVQCAGSGRQVTGVVMSANPKGVCPVCHKRKGVTSNGRIRRHDAFKRIKGGR